MKRSNITLSNSLFFENSGQVFNVTAPHWLTESVITGIMRLIDCVLSLLTGVMAASILTLRQSEIEYINLDQTQVYALIAATLLTANVFHLSKLYHLDADGLLSLMPGRIVAGWSMVVFILLALGFATRTTVDISRLWVGLWFTMGLTAIMLARLTCVIQIRLWRSNGHLTRRIAVVGGGPCSRRLIEDLISDSKLFINLIGYFEDNREHPMPRPDDVPVAGTIDDLIRLAREGKIDQIIIALSSDNSKYLGTWTRRFLDLSVNVSVYSDLINNLSLPRYVTQLGTIPLLTIIERPLPGWSYIIKTAEDYILATILLIVAAPLMMIIALAILLDSPGPIFFRQMRYGLNNQPIEILKFRTMWHEIQRLNSSEPVRQATRVDPRVTPVGWLLRRSSLDELPQLINVLRGEMSVVGPRPHAIVHNHLYAGMVDAYSARHRVKPGITGWAQVQGLRGEILSKEMIEKRIAHDLYYIDNWSLGLDVRILFRTVLFGFVHEMAY